MEACLCSRLGLKCTRSLAASSFTAPSRASTRKDAAAGPPTATAGPPAARGVPAPLADADAAAAWQAQVAALMRAGLMDAPGPTSGILMREASNNHSRASVHRGSDSAAVVLLSPALPLWSPARMKSYSQS